MKNNFRKDKNVIPTQGGLLAELHEGLSAPPSGLIQSHPAASGIRVRERKEGVENSAAQASCGNQEIILLQRIH